MSLEIRERGNFIFIRYVHFFSFLARKKRKETNQRKEKSAKIPASLRAAKSNGSSEKISVILNLFQDLRNFFTTSLAIAATPHARMKTLRRLAPPPFIRKANHIPSPLEADLHSAEQNNPVNCFVRGDGTK